MKRLFVLALVSIALLSCSEPNENCGNTLVESSFYEMFPSATDLEWEIEAGYYVADFQISKEDVTAWFTTEGVWQMSKWDIKKSAMPSAVESAFESSAYGDWTIEDVEKIERLGMDDLYLIDARDRLIDVDSANEVEVQISPSGEILSTTVNGIDNDDYYLLP